MLKRGTLLLQLASLHSLIGNATESESLSSKSRVSSDSVLTNHLTSECPSSSCSRQPLLKRPPIPPIRCIKSRLPSFLPILPQVLGKSTSVYCSCCAASYSGGCSANIAADKAHCSTRPAECKGDHKERDYREQSS